ncbi:MAG: hypothetical protein R6V76_09640, partial [Desulfobacterales bacterium]
VGESVSDCGTTDLSNYDTTISCVDRGLSTFNGGSPLVISGTSLDVPVDKDDDIVCTITNTKDTGFIKVNKYLDSDGDGEFETLNPSTYDWILDDEATTYDMGTTESGILIGTHTINETPYSDICGISCATYNVYVSAQSLDFLELAQNCLFPNWKRISVHKDGLVKSPSSGRGRVSPGLR